MRVFWRFQSFWFRDVNVWTPNLFGVPNRRIFLQWSQDRDRDRMKLDSNSDRTSPLDLPKLAHKIQSLVCGVNVKHERALWVSPIPSTFGSSQLRMDCWKSNQMTRRFEIVILRCKNKVWVWSWWSRVVKWRAKPWWWKPRRWSILLAVFAPFK